MISAVYGIEEFTLVTLLVIQIVNSSPSGMCSCPTCGCAGSSCGCGGSSCGCQRENVYNTIFSPPCPCTGCQSYNNQNPVCPSSPGYSYCNGQYCDKSYSQPTDNSGSPCVVCGGYPIYTQIPPAVQPTPRYTYSFAAATPSGPCPQTYKNFNYQLQLPAAPPTVSSYGTLDTTIGKTFKKCPPCPCKPMFS